MKNKLKYFIILVIVLLMLLFIKEIYNKFSKNNEVYNITIPIEYKKNINTKGVAVFNEYVFDNFNGIKIKNDNKKIHRSDEILDKTNDNEAFKNAIELEKFITESQKENNLNKTYKDIKNDLFINKFNRLKLNHYSLNSDFEFYKDIYRNYIDNKSVKLQESGYIVNYLDGYENLINLFNIDDDIKKMINNKIYKIPGLKYVDNKEYKLLIFIDNINNIDKEYLTKNTILKIGKDNIKAELIKENIFKEKDILLFKTSDNIEKMIDNRFFDVNIEYRNILSYKVPKTSVIDKKIYKGVLFLKDNIVKFSPIKILGEEGDYYYISNDFNIIFPELKNKENLKFDKLNSYDKVLINPDKYKEGDRY